VVEAALAYKAGREVLVVLVVVEYTTSNPEAQVHQDRVTQAVQKPLHQIPVLPLVAGAVLEL
jgi:hypothetical protein